MTSLTTVLAIVTPHSREERVEDQASLAVGQRVVRVYVTAAPEHGRANAAVIDLVAHHFGVAVSLVTMIRGFRGRRKLLTLPLNAKRVERESSPPRR